jgi:RluA family pseudouridine synthase
VNESLPTRCPILHRDRFLIGVDKPSGVLSHPNPGRRGELAAFEGRYDEKAQCFESIAGRVWLMHRLDQDTSGVLLGALDEATAGRCREAFETGAMAKTYLAAVRGNPGREGVWLDHLATSHERGRVRTAVVKGRPPNAELHFRQLAHDPMRRLSLLEIRLLTGKTHQIRVQAASRQHHLLGDDVYGHFELNRRLRAEAGLKRLFLHAARLEFKHPASGQPLRLEAPLPEDLVTVRACLGLG